MRHQDLPAAASSAACHHPPPTPQNESEHSRDLSTSLRGRQPEERCYVQATAGSIVTLLFAQELSMTMK